MRWVVVGGGTAGCVVAARLAANPALAVIVLEAGSGSGRTGGGSLDELAVAGSTWDGVVAREQDGASRPYPQGRGLGGTSRINGGVLGEGRGGGRDGWDGGRDGAADGLPAERVPPAELGAVDRALLAAAPGAQRLVLARRGGRLVSTAEAFLDPASGSPNLDVRRDATVVRVLLDGHRAVGVALDDGSTVAADRVVLCAGAIFTPVILRRSGLAPAGLGELVDRPSRVIDLVLRDGVEVDRTGLVSGAAWRGDGIEIMAMNHVGRAAPGRAALLVGGLAARRRARIIDDPGDPARLPALDFEPLDRAARHALDRGVARAEALLAGPEFGRIVAGHEVAPAPGGYFHATGSCRAGVVTDDDGSVRDHRHLYVADASVLDLAPSGPLAAVIATASRLAAAWASRPA